VRARGYFEQEGAGACDFLSTGSAAKTIEGIKEGGSMPFNTPFADH